MTKYSVCVNIDLEFEVEAKDEDDARYKAIENWRDEAFDGDVDVYEVNCLEEEEEDEVDEFHHYPIEEIGGLGAQLLLCGKYPIGCYYRVHIEGVVAYKHTPRVHSMGMFDTKEEAIDWLKRGAPLYD